MPALDPDASGQPLVESLVSEGVALLTLDDPGRRNALNRAMCTRLIGLVRSFEADDSVKALVITGRGPAFCGKSATGCWARRSRQSVPRKPSFTIE